MFQIKDFNSIVLSQINHARAVTDKVTDFQPGSVVRTLMESSAVEIEELYLQTLLGLRDAIPVATFLSFGFDKLPAKRARGFVSISQSEPMGIPLFIPADTAFTTVDGRSYTSTEPVSWPTGQSLIRVPVACTVAGVDGNVSAGMITQSGVFGADFTISNALIESGADLESDIEREVRFAEFIQSLSRGTLLACTYAARQSSVLDVDGNIFEYVVRLGINETPGYVRIYLYSNRGTPSPALLADGQLRLDGSRDDAAGTITAGYRPAGVRVQVLAMDERLVPLSIQVGMLEGWTLTEAVRQNLGDIYSSAIAAIQPGSTVYLGLLVEALLAAPGISSIVPVTSSNISCGLHEVLAAGALTITEL